MPGNAVKDLVPSLPTTAAYASFVVCRADLLRPLKETRSESPETHFTFWVKITTKLALQLTELISHPKLPRTTTINRAVYASLVSSKANLQTINNMIPNKTDKSIQFKHLHVNHSIRSFCWWTMFILKVNSPTPWTTIKHQSISVNKLGESTTNNTIQSNTVHFTTKLHKPVG